MPTKQPTDLKSVTLDQVNALEGKNVIGGGSAPTASADRAAKVAKDNAKLAKDEQKQMAGGGGAAKQKSDASKTAKDMKKVARDG